MSIKHWLQSINLDQYLSDLTRGGYTSIEQCSTLTDEKLQQLGITLAGHKKRMLAYLPRTDDFKVMEDDHLYGNVPLPSETNCKDAIKTGTPHTYVNTPAVTSDPIYGNVSMPSSTRKGDSTEVSLHSLIDDDTVKDDSESFYDILPHSCDVSREMAFDPGEYVNIAPPLEGAVGGVDAAPALPPKKNKGNRRSVNEIMGITPPVDETAKRPVPKPRTTVRKGRTSLGASDLSPGNSTVDLKKGVAKPTPKPRPRPAPRGKKPQSASASPCSSTSDSPRHSVNASPVSLPSPAPRDLSPDMPREQAPVPPKPQLNEEDKPLSIENVSSPDVPIHKVPSPPQLLPSYEPKLSMDTEVPPAPDPFPCETSQVKVPLPNSCLNNNIEKDRAISKITLWSDNEVYESTNDPKGFTDPENPQRLDDFIQSLVSQATKDKKDNTPQPLVQKSENEPESEELYQVIFSTASILNNCS